MKAELLKQTIAALFALKRTVCIEGPPGVGKTSVVRQVASDLDIPVIERHMPTMLVEDFGILFPMGEDQLNYKLPFWFPQSGKGAPEGILLFDDRNQASADLQKVLANICQARTLHGIPMGEGWMVVSTGNRQADRAGANRILSHLRNRETVLNLDTDTEGWCNWANRNNVRHEVISFIRYRPEHLHNFDPQRDINATPRSWVDGVSALLGKVPSASEFECFKGAVGEAIAVEFLGYMRIFSKLPNLDKILDDPSKGKVPKDPMVLYAISGALADRANEENFANVCVYAKRMPPEFSILTVATAVRRNIKLTEQAAYGHWAVDHQGFIL